MPAPIRRSSRRWSSAATTSACWRTACWRPRSSRPEPSTCRGARTAAAEPRPAERAHEGLGHVDSLPGIRARARLGRWSARRACSRRTSVPSFSVAPRTSSWATSSCSAPRSPPKRRPSVRVPRVQPAVVPGVRDATARPRLQARARAARPGLDRAINRVMARLFDKGLDQLNDARRANGLEPAEVRARELRARRPAASDDEPGVREYEQFSPPPNVRLVGPRLDDPVWAGEWTPPPRDSSSCSSA